MRVGRIAGIDVLVTSSWFLVAAMIAFIVAPRVDQVQPGLGAGKYVIGLAFAVLLYLAILLHEASHAIVAKRLGYGVTSITLHFLGGVTEIDSSARRPRDEFLIAVVGPLTSLLVGAAALGAWFVAPSGIIQMVLEGLAGANLLIGLLNLVPGLPLDGGRVLKSAVWGIRRDAHAGTIAAGWGGRIVAVLLVAWPFVSAQVTGVPTNLFSVAIFLIMGMFMWAGSTAAMANARLRRRLPSLQAKPLARRAIAVPEELPLSEAVRQAQASQAGSIVTIDASGRPVGIVNENALLAVPDERRPWVAASSVARTLEDGLSLPVDLAGEELVLAITRRPADEYLLVASDGSLYGVLATADVDRAFRESAH
jgi:Zn-dependent protease